MLAALGHVEGEEESTGPQWPLVLGKDSTSSSPLPIPNGTEPTGTAWVMTGKAQDPGMAFKQEEHGS